ncbi:MAG: c(7)-type cytochrome triheme domain-containing protein [Thermodesulfobacteriota bacterium]
MARRKNRLVTVGIRVLLVILMSGIILTNNKTLNAEEIDPRGLDWAGLEWGDLILDKQWESMKKAKVDRVQFPHWFHRIRFRCKACHEIIFEMKKGANNINMSGIINGKWCGKCHNGQIAFAPVECKRCHSYNREARKQQLLLAKLEEKAKQQSMPVEEAAGEDEEEEGDDEEVSPFSPERKIEIDTDSPVYLNTRGKLGSTGDPGSLASKAAFIGSGWHPDALEAEGLPKDRWGLIDWAQIIRDGKIAPKISADPKIKRNKFEDWVILFETKSDFIEDVIFPHDVHTFWLDCKSCHTRIFKDKQGSNPVYMTEISEGKWCGWCHGKIAFPLDGCTRCHVQRKGEAEE